MTRVLLMLLAILLMGCSHDNPPPPPPTPSPTQDFTFYYGSVAGQRCDSFDFPGPGGGAHYCTKAIGLAQGQTITMTFTLTGGSVLPVQADDIPPATTHLFLWRRNDPMTCTGAYQQYRWWSAAKADLMPGTQTISATLNPENWTDCYGRSGAQNPAAFAAALSDLQGVGYTFGGQYFFGHGAYASQSAHFTLNSYATGSQSKRKKRGPR